MRFILITFLAASFFVTTSVVKADEPLDDRIDKLINAVGESNCQFSRNGKTYNPEDGVAHIRKKYKYYKDDIDSIDKFIELSASRSMMSGKPYWIHCAGSEDQLSSIWMSQKAIDIGVIE